jgi:hypothetical protein
MRPAASSERMKIDKIPNNHTGDSSVATQEEGFSMGLRNTGSAAVVGIDDFSRIVSAIYASALTPENWIVAMADIRRTLDAQSAGLLLADGAGRSIMSASLPSEAENAYSEYYCRMDYVLDAVDKGPLGLVQSGQPLVALKAGSEFDADFMRPHQMDADYSCGSPTVRCRRVSL